MEIRVSVFHSKRPRFKDFCNFKLSDFQFVYSESLADGNIPSGLESVFSKTQNGQLPWNPESHMRSTSAGDLMRVNLGTDVELFFCVSGIGYQLASPIQE